MPRRYDIPYILGGRSAVVTTPAIRTLFFLLGTLFGSSSRPSYGGGRFHCTRCAHQSFSARDGDTKRLDNFPRSNFVSMILFFFNQGCFTVRRYGLDNRSRRKWCRTSLLSVDFSAEQSTVTLAQDYSLSLYSTASSNGLGLVPQVLTWDDAT